MEMNIKKIKPMFNRIITTAKVYTEDELKSGGIIDSTKMQMSIREYQTVVAVGNTVKDIKVGDLVKLNYDRYLVRKYKENSIQNDINKFNPVDEYRFRIVTMNHETYLQLYDSDVEYVIEEYGEEEPQSDIIVPNKDIITA